MSLDCTKKENFARLRFFLWILVDFSLKLGLIHGIIHTFKKYFAIVFSVFSNKLLSLNLNFGERMILTF